MAGAKITHLLYTVLSLVTLSLTASLMFISLEVLWFRGDRYFEHICIVFLSSKGILLFRLNEATKRSLKVLVLAYPRFNKSSQIKMSFSNCLKFIIVIVRSDSSLVGELASSLPNVPY